ncbi:MAG TPA: hypothetical protein VNN07_06110 [Candidatus Tectomicrobia bacterium]|nr:hypothetical protein [Candidatus Tectomicrobia bacterium]
MPHHRAAMLLSLWLLLQAPTAALAQNYAPGSLDHYFRIEAEPMQDARGTIFQGYVYNLYAYPADRMRLLIESVDAGGQVTGRTRLWIAGHVPPFNRAWFSTRVPPAASYRVQIDSFDWVGRGGGGS